MELSLSEEQELLRSSVAKYVQDNCSVEQRRRLRETELGFDMTRWREFAEMGWLSLPVAEENGGLGASAVELMVLMQEFGRALVPEPYLTNVVVCGSLLASMPVPERESQLRALMAGEKQWAFAFAEHANNYHLCDTALAATSTATGFELTGRKIAVVNAHAADNLIVLARTSRTAGRTEGLSLFAISVETPGLRVTPLNLVDGSKGALVEFEAVRLGNDALIGELDQGLDTLQPAIDLALIGMGAEALGAVEALLEQTVEYTSTREQFGQPLASFQALQHRMAVMHIKIESLKSIVRYAAIAHAEGFPDRSRWAAALKVKLADVGRYVSQQAVQLHGGIGTTDELVVGHYFKRLMLLSVLFGDADHHLLRFAKPG